jgi:asparagine synthase (glutamine-hydrolysing)
MTMANSLELRGPFLDIEVFKVAGTVPTRLKLAENTTKYALREAIAEIVPPHVLQPAQAGLPRPDPALAQGRHVRLGGRRVSHQPGRGAD